MGRRTRPAETGARFPGARVMRSSQRGFTLVELLMVLLLPYAPAGMDSTAGPIWSGTKAGWCIATLPGSRSQRAPKTCCGSRPATPGRWRSAAPWAGTGCATSPRACPAATTPACACAAAGAPCTLAAWWSTSPEEPATQGFQGTNHRPAPSFPEPAGLDPGGGSFKMPVPARIAQPVRALDC